MSEYTEHQAQLDDAALPRPSLKELFRSRDSFKALFLVFPNGLRLWYSIFSTVFFSLAMVVSVTVYDAPRPFIWLVCVVGGLICLWSLMAEVIGLMTTCYNTGREDEYDKFREALDDVVILNWPESPT